MKNKYTARVSFHPFSFRDRQLTESREIIVRQLAAEFSNAIKDKLNPWELQDTTGRFGYGQFDYRTYEQTLYIFTKQELEEYIKRMSGI